MVSSSLQDVESRYNRAIEEKTMLEQELISKQQVEEESQRLKDEIRGHSFRFPLSLIWSQELMACIVVRLSDLQTEVSVLKQTRPRIPSSNHLPPPQPHMPSLLESSQELSMSDLEPNATFLSNSNPTSSSANEPTLSPTITIRQSLEAPTSPSPGQTSFPSSSGVVRSASSPVVSRIPHLADFPNLPPTPKTLPPLPSIRPSPAADLPLLSLAHVNPPAKPTFNPPPTPALLPTSPTRDQRVSEWSPTSASEFERFKAGSKPRLSLALAEYTFHLSTHPSRPPADPHPLLLILVREPSHLPLARA
jgi:hypothetical protein